MVEAGAFALYDDSLYYIVKVSKDGADVSLVRMDDYRDGYRKDDIDKVSVDAVHMIPIPALQQIYGEGKVNVNDSEEIHYTTELASGRKLRVVIEDKDTFNVAMMIKNRVGSFYLDYDPKKKMPKERQEIDQWEEQDGNDEKFFFADGLFTEGAARNCRKQKLFWSKSTPTSANPSQR